MITNNFFYFQDNLLKEGGVAGHLSHVYDNYELPFSKLKHILELASSGKLVGTEKTDGFNIFMTFRDGQARCARNKTDIKNGGMSLGELMRRPFAGGDKVKSVFIEAFETFEKAVYGLDESDIEQIFGPNGNIYYNIEIMGPAAENVINYDTFVLSVHHGGYGYFDRETGLRRDDIDATANSEYLDSVISKMQQAISNDRFNIQRTALVHLKNISDDTYVKKAKQRIDQELARFNLSDDSTILDYLSASLRNTLSASGQFKTHGKDFLNLAVDSILGIKNLKDIPAGTPKEIRSFMSQFSSSKKEARDMLKKAIWPIEDIIHDFAVQLLSGLESAYILDNSKEVQRLKGELEKAIHAIKSYKGEHAEEAQDILHKQLTKIKHIDNINTVVEGFVFEFEGHLYKFTGNYAPVNQLLGLYKWGRGSVPALKGSGGDGELSETVIGMVPADAGSMVPDAPESARKLAYAVIPGGFKPPHAGHYDMVNKIAELKRPNGEYLVKEVRVLISPKPRDSHHDGNSIQITAEDALAIWKIYTQNNPRIIPEISKSSSPVRATYEFMENMQPNSIMVVATSEKDRNDKRFDSLQAWSDTHDYGVLVKTVVVDEYGENVSGTAMRNYIVSGDTESFLANLPTHLSRQQQLQVWNIVSGNDEENIALYEADSRSILRLDRQNNIHKYGYQKLDEISNMYATMADEFLTAAKEGYGRDLSFNDVFNGKLREIIDLPSEYVGDMKDIQEFLENSKWELDISKGSVTRAINYTIPAGPKQGEVIQKNQEISLGKLISKFDSLRSSLDSSSKSFRNIFEKTFQELIKNNSERNKFLKFIYEKYNIETKVNKRLYDNGSLDDETKDKLANDLFKYIDESFKIYLENSNYYSFARDGTTPTAVSFENFLKTLVHHYGKYRIDEVIFNDAMSWSQIFRDIEFSLLYKTRQERVARLAGHWTPPRFLPVPDSIDQQLIDNFDWYVDGAWVNRNFIEDIIEYYDTVKSEFDKVYKIFTNIRENTSTNGDASNVYHYFFDPNLSDIFHKWLNFWNKNSEKFQLNPNFAKGEKWAMIVTRHPVDVLRMSDFENIQSCHSYGGSFFQCAVAESQGHGLVAYVVNKEKLDSFLQQIDEDPTKLDSTFQNDEIFVDYDRNVKGLAPVTRLRVRKYVKELGEEQYEIAAPELKKYGQDIPYMLETLTKWLYDKQVTKILQYEGYKDEKELLEKKLDTEKFRRYGGTYEDTTDRQIFSNFLKDPYYKESGSVFLFRNEDPIEREVDTWEDEPDNLLRRLEQQLEEWERNCNEIIANYEHISAYVDYEVQNHEDYYYHGGLSMSISEADFASVLGGSEEDFYFNFPTKYPGTRALENVVSEVLYDFDIYGQISTDSFQSRGLYTLSLNVMPEENYDLDDWYSYFRRDLFDFDANYEDFLSSLAEKFVKEGYIEVLEDEDSISIESFIGSLPFEHFDVEKDGLKITFSKHIYIGPVFLIPPIKDSLKAPINSTHTKSFFEDFLNYNWKYFSEMQNSVDKQQVQMNLTENEQLNLGSGFEVSFDIATSWNKIDIDNETITGDGYGGFHKQYYNNLAPSDDRYAADIKFEITDNKEIKFINLPSRTMPVMGKLQITLDTIKFSKNEEQKDFLKFILWLDKTNFKMFREMSAKYLKFLNAAGLKAAHTNWISKVGTEILPKMPYFAQSWRGSNQASALKPDDIWVLNGLAFYKNFANIDPTKSVNLSAADMKDLIMWLGVSDYDTSNKLRENLALPSPKKKYYNITPDMTVEEIHKRWLNGQKAYDGTFYFSLEEVASYKEFEWTSSNFRDMYHDKDKFKNLEQDMLQKGWLETKPAVILLGKNGCAKIGEGNHRLAIALKNKHKFNKIPVQFLFYETVTSNEGNVKCLETVKEISAMGGGAISGGDSNAWAGDGAWSKKKKNFI